MKYDIEYQVIGEDVWHCLGEGYSTQGEALTAIPTVIARGGKWARRAYRVREKHATEPTHLELIRLVERLETEDADFAFWAEDDAEAVLLLGDDRVVVAVPGAPLWEGHDGGRPIGAIVSEIRARVRADHERVDKERADRGQWEKEQKERAERERADRERVDRERAERERADRAQWEKDQKERAERERADRERADRERADREHAERAKWAKEQQERAEQERAKRAQREQAQREQAQREQAQREQAQREQAQREQREQAQREQREQAQRERAQREQREQAQREQAQREQAQRDRDERTAWDHARDGRAERQPTAPVPSPVASAPPPVAWAAPYAPRARVAPVPSPTTAAPAALAARTAVHPPPRAAPAAPAARMVPVAPPARVTPAPVVSPARAAPVASPVRGTAVSPTAARGAARGDVPNPRPRPGPTSALAALAKLLRCGAWREGMRSSAIVASDPPDGLPTGAHSALQELAGVAQPTARELGNALKRVVDKRINGIAQKLTCKADGHGFAIWQVVHDPDEPNKAPERPANAELVRSALTGMGYRRPEAEYAVSTLGARVDTEPLAELVREALGVLAQRPAPGPRPKER